MRAPNVLIASTVTPASSGRPGPGEITIRSGCMRSISGIDTSSLRRTTVCAPSSPRYCARLNVNES